MNIKKYTFKNRNYGFTLIELLIVIAILGVLAVVVLLALNPVQQLARTRDAGRISAVTQLGHSVEAYATSNNGVYPLQNGTWITQLVNAGEIATVPAGINYSVAGSAVCANNAQPAGNGFCYLTTGGAGSGTAPVLVYARLEAAANINRCTATFVGTNQAYAFYASSLGRGGITCTTNAQPAITPANILP
jgi:prepilin-type N-terminal cleavage/methylation domain-containing protein